MRQRLKNRLEIAPEDKSTLRRLGNLALVDGNLGDAVHLLRLAAEVQTVLSWRSLLDV